MSHNDITGDKIATKAPTKAYRDGWDAIFRPDTLVVGRPVAGFEFQGKPVVEGERGGHLLVVDEERKQDEHLR